MSKASVKTISLPAIVDLDVIDQIRDALLESLERGGVRIEAGAVERVATNALFMLLSAAQTARRNEFEFEVAAPSESMLAAVDRLGLKAPFVGIMEGY